MTTFQQFLIEWRERNSRLLTGQHTVLSREDKPMKVCILKRNKEVIAVCQDRIIAERVAEADADRLFAKSGLRPLNAGRFPWGFAYSIEEHEVKER